MRYISFTRLTRIAKRGFNLSASCDLGEHRHNPLVDFDKYDCPVKNISLWKDLNKLKVHLLLQRILTSKRLKDLANFRV